LNESRYYSLSLSFSAVLVLNSHMLARQTLYHLSHSTSPFFFSYFLGRVSCFSLWLVLGHDPLPYGLLHGWTIAVPLLAHLVGWDGGLANFLPMIASNLILLIATSQVARIGLQMWVTMPDQDYKFLNRSDKIADFWK
jgi:hypothetical protein